MATVTIDQVEHIARLARLRFSPSEIEGFTAQFNQILEYVDRLGDVDTSGVEPMESVAQGTNVLRDDMPGAMLTAAEALSNAPKRTEGFFSVPRVLGEGGE